MFRVFVLVGLAMATAFASPITMEPMTTNPSGFTDSTATEAELLHATGTGTMGTTSALLNGQSASETPMTTESSTGTTASESSLLRHHVAISPMSNRLTGRVILANTRMEDSEEWGVTAEQAEVACDRIARYQPKAPHSLLRSFIERFWTPRQPQNPKPMEGHLLSVRSTYEVVALSRLLKPLPAGAYWTGGQLTRYRVNSMHEDRHENHVILTWTDGRVGDPKVLGMTPLDEEQLREGYTYCLALNLREATWQARDCTDLLPYACFISPRRVGFSNKATAQTEPMTGTTGTESLTEVTSPTESVSEGTMAQTTTPIGLSTPAETIMGGDITISTIGGESETTTAGILAETEGITGGTESVTEPVSDMSSGMTESILNEEMTTPATAFATGTNTLTENLLNEEINSEATVTIPMETGTTQMELMNGEADAEVEVEEGTVTTGQTASMTTAQLLEEQMTTEATSTGSDVTTPDGTVELVETPGENNAVFEGGEDETEMLSDDMEGEQEQEEGREEEKKEEVSEPPIDGVEIETIKEVAVDIAATTEMPTSSEGTATSMTEKLLNAVQNGVTEGEVTMTTGTQSATGTTMGFLNGVANEQRTTTPMMKTTRLGEEQVTYESS